MHTIERFKIMLFAMIVGLCIAIVPIALAGDPWALWPIKLSLRQEMIAEFTMILGPLVAAVIMMALTVDPQVPQPPRGRKSHPAVSFGQR